MRTLVLWIAVTLAAPVAASGGPCGKITVEERFGSPELLEHIFTDSKVVILARVIDVAPKDDRATLLVLKSWKGPFDVASSVEAGWPNFPTSGPWILYRVSIGDEVLVFASVVDPLWLDHCSVVPRAEASKIMVALDALVAGKQRRDAGL